MTVLKQNFYSKSPIYYLGSSILPVDTTETLWSLRVDFNIKTFKKYIIIGNFENNEISKQTQM